MTQWLPATPGTGDTSGISALGTMLDVAVDQFAQAGDALRARRPAQIYRAQFLTAFDQCADPYLAQLSSVGGAIARIADALAIYSAAVQSISERATAVQSQGQDALQALASANRCVAAARLPGVSTSAATMGVYRANVVSAQDRCTRIAAAMQSLADERSTADAAVLRALDGECLSSSWSTTGAALAAGGLSRPDLITAASMTAALVDLTRVVTSGKASAADLAALTAYLSALQGDPRAADAYFRALGGRGAVDLVNALGDGVYAGGIDAQVALDAAIAVRALLSVASRHWEGDRAQEFANQMLDALDGAGAVAFLFGDAMNHPLGEALTVAMLDLFDENERINGNVWMSLSPGGGLMLTNLQGLGIPGRGIDPVSAVLETLGRYPDAALDWVSADLLQCTAEGTVGRIEYWFGQRSWDSDGYQGVGGLWAGMQNATGADLSDGYDPVAWRRLQTANAHVWEALALSDRFEVSTVSAFGASYLADALASQLLVIGTIAVAAETEVFGLDPGEVLQDVALPCVGSRWIPLIPADYLYRVFGIAASYEHTREGLGVAIANLQDALTSSGRGSIVTNLDVAVGLQAINDGTSGGADLAGAAARDALMGQNVDALANAVSIVTSLRVANPVLGIVVGEGISAGSSAVKDWSSVYEDVRAQVRGQNTTQREVVRQAAADYAAQAFTPEDWVNARQFIGQSPDASDGQVANGYGKRFEISAGYAEGIAAMTGAELRQSLADAQSNNEKGK